MSDHATRRAVLAAGLLALAGCGSGSSTRPAPSSAAAGPSPAPTPAAGPELAVLERSSGARIGVVAQRSGQVLVAHRADERFPMCSVHKVLTVAAVLRRDGARGLDRRIRYGENAVLDYAPITVAHVRDGMTVAQLCDAALRYSDNTAANLLIGDLGGAAAVTAYARSLGDPVTRLDRSEPDLNSADPGDPRDTTTPRAFAADLAALVLGPALPADLRARLTGWLDGNTTGDAQIRAAAPAGWSVGDKTGSGDHGTANDVAVLRPPSGAPVVLTVFTTGLDQDAGADPALVREVAAATLKVSSAARR